MNAHSYRTLVLGLGALALGACSESSDGPATSPSSTAPDFAVVSNSWITRRDMRFYRVGVTTATVRNAAGQSVVYVIGGNTESMACLGRVQAYNATTNTWQGATDLPVALCNMNGAGVIGGKIYVSGGSWRYESSRPRTAALYVYNPATNAWSRKHDMPVRGAGGVTGVIQGKLYVVTSTLDDVPHFYRYDPATDSWTTLPTPTNYHWLGGGGGVIGGKLYLIAQATKVYDPATNRWTTKGLLPGDLHGSSLGLNGKLYVFGADTRTGFEVPGIFIYDPVGNAWSKQPLLTTLRDSYNLHAASQVFVDGKARAELVAGGAPGNNIQYIP